MCQHPVRMNKGIDALFNLIKAESPLSPMNGDIYIFFGQNRQNVKILKWDTDGFLLYHKRLERGSFELPKLIRLQAIMSYSGRLSASSCRGSP